MITFDELVSELESYYWPEPENPWPLVEVGNGWLPLVLETHQKLKELDPEYQILQIKEKFGGLRYYIATQNEEAYDIVDEAERRSITICEKCGEPGKLRGGGWMKTFCDKHGE